MDFVSFFLGCIFSSLLILLLVKIRVNKLKKSGVMSEQRRPKVAFNKVYVEDGDSEDAD